jgi:phosphatidate cytidylyltransferase
MMQSEFLKRIISSVILIPIVLFFIIKGSFLFTFFVLLCFVISSYEWHLLSKKKKYYYPGFIFLIFSFLSFHYLGQLDYGEVMFFILVICVSTDIGGYIFGKIFKGPKLTKLSPNKTYAGAVGGILISIISAYYYLLWTYGDYYIFANFPEETFLLICTTISIISQFGDIIISYFKRLVKVKNTGNFIPGHGGILDRIDGMIFVFPFVHLIELTNIKFVINYIS